MCAVSMKVRPSRLAKPQIYICSICHLVVETNTSDNILTSQRNCDGKKVLVFRNGQKAFAVLLRVKLMSKCAAFDSLVRVCTFGANTALMPFRVCFCTRASAMIPPACMRCLTRLLCAIKFSL